MAGKPSVAVGTWGGSGGGRWDDTSDYDGIKEITIYSGAIIDSITVVYEKNGVSVVEGKHGGDGGGPTVINLEYPDEYLVEASGTYGSVTFVGTPVVTSLTFKTNKQTYGPFGTQEGTAFSLPIELGLIVSFFGRSGVYLDAIGFRIAAIDQNKIKLPFS